MRKGLLFTLLILMLSACDKVVINYGEGSDVNEWQDENPEHYNK